MIPQIHRKLVRWGNWVRSQRAGGKGYPTASPLYKQIMFGTVVGVPVYYQIEVDELDSEGSAVNADIIKLPTEDVRILRMYYVENGTAKQKASRLGISRAGLFLYLHSIQQKLAD